MSSAAQTMKTLRCGFLILSLALWGMTLARAEDQTIDLLVVYTPALASSYGGHDGVEALVQSSLISSNQAFSNSGVSLKLRLVGLQAVEYVEDAHEMGVDIAHLGNRDGVMDEVLDWREDTGADLVYLFRSDNREIDHIGIAHQLNNVRGTPSRGFGVASGQYVLGDLVLQHEIGHNLGAAHDPDNTDGPGLFSYSYGHRFGPSNAPDYFRSIMAYSPGFEVNYFSSPDVIFEDLATGTDGADNARTLRQSAPLVAAYRGSLPLKPLAHAGADQLVDDLDNDGKGEVQLDGSRSRALDGIVSWEWTWSGGSASGENATVELPVGTHEVLLTVRNQSQRTSTDTVMVTVAEFSAVKRTFAGGGRLFILRENGSLYGAGSNHGEALGIANDDGYSSVLPEFQRIPLDNVEEVVTAENHTLFRLRNGAVYASGFNSYGAMGTGAESQWGRLLKVFDSGIVSVSTSFGFSLFVHRDGRVFASGSDSSGNFGRPPSGFEYSPVSIFPSGARKAVAGRAFSAILKGDGSIWLAGDILSYAKPELRSSEHAQFHSLVNSGFVDIAAGDGHLVGLAADGSVWTTGASHSGQLGNGIDASRQEGFFKILDAGAEAIMAGPDSTFVRLNSGFIVGAGQALPSQDEAIEDDQHSLVTLFRGRAVQLSAGSGFGAVLLKDGSVWAMGSNSYGQFGLGPDTGGELPLTKILPTTDSQFQNSPPTAVGRVDGFAIDHDGDGYASVQFDSSGSFDDWAIVSYRWTWPDGSSDEANPELILPVGSVPMVLTVTDDIGVSTSQNFTVEVKPYARVIDVLALDNRILILKDDGSLWGVGSNYSNAFGVDSERSRLEEFEVLLGEGVVQMAGGESHTLALLEDGSLWGGGSNSSGQLGLGSDVGSVAFQQIWPSGVVEIAAGDFHSLFVLEDGRAMAMGSNYFGQTGDMSGANEVRFPRELYSNGVVQGLASGISSALLLENGKVLVTDRLTRGLRELSVPSVDKLLSFGVNALFYRTVEGNLEVGALEGVSVPVGNFWFGSSHSPLERFGVSIEQVAVSGSDVVVVDENGRSLGTNMNLVFGDPLAVREDELEEYFFGQVAAISCSPSYRVFLLEGGSVWAAETWEGRNGRFLAGYSESAPLIRLVDGSPLRVNEAPTAVVPDSQLEYYDAFEQGGSVVLLDGSLCRDDQAIRQWEWSWGDTTVYGRLNPQLFPIGDWNVTLRVTDYDGSSDSIEFTVSVRDDQSVAALSDGVVFLENGQAYSSSKRELGIHGYPQTTRWLSEHMARLPMDGIVSTEEKYRRFLAIDEAGGVWVSGGNSQAELGLGYAQSSLSSPQKVFQSGAVDSAIGLNSLYLVFDDGSLWSTESRDGREHFQNVDPSLKTWSRKLASGIQQVVTLEDLVVYLKDNGSVWAYGHSPLTALGPYRHSDFIPPETPLQLVSSGVRQIHADSNRILVVKEDGSLWGMGANWDAALGVNQDYVNRFVRLSEGPVRKFGSAEKMIVWLLEDNSLWGSGPWFESFGGRHRPRSLPIQAAPLLFGHVRDFAVVDSQLIALRTDGKLYAASYGDFDELLSREERVGPYWKPLNKKSDLKGPLPPVANAGEDLEVYIRYDGDEVLLDGSLSTDDWAIAKWRWSIGEQVSDYKVAQFRLGAGSYVAELRVEDEYGQVSTDTMNVKIVSGSEIQASLQRYFSKAEIDDMSDPENLDFDGDSFSNREEISMGTNPKDFDSRARLSVVDKNRNPHLVLEENVNNWALSIEYSSDLKTWHELDRTTQNVVLRGLELSGEMALPLFFRIRPNAE